MPKELKPVPINLVRDIRSAIESASEPDERTAMFHLQVFLNAGELYDVRARDFCDALGMEEIFRPEYKKMLDLRQLLEKQGYSVVTAA